MPVKVSGGYDYIQYSLERGRYINETVSIPIDNSAQSRSVYAISVPYDIDSVGIIRKADSSTVFPLGTEVIEPVSECYKSGSFAFGK